MSGILVAWGDFIFVGLALAGGVVLEKKLGIYDKIKAPIDWIKSKF